MCGSFLSRCHTSLWDSLISHRLGLLNIQCVPVLEVPRWIGQGLMMVWSKWLLDHESLAWMSSNRIDGSGLNISRVSEFPAGH